MSSKLITFIPMILLAAGGSALQVLFYDNNNACSPGNSLGFTEWSYLNGVQDPPTVCTPSSSNRDFCTWWPEAHGLGQSSRCSDKLVDNLQSTAAFGIPAGWQCFWYTDEQCGDDTTRRDFSTGPPSGGGPSCFGPADIGGSVARAFKCNKIGDVTYLTKPYVGEGLVDVGNESPADLMKELAQHCSDSTCESSFTITTGTASNNKQEPLQLTFTVDATYDGTQVRDQFIQALSNMAGATTQSWTVPYSNNQAGCGNSGGCSLPGGGEQGTSQMAQFKAARSYQLSRFVEGTGAIAGNFRVTINPTNDNDACTTLFTEFGAVASALPSGILSGFFGSLGPVACYTSKAKRAFIG